MLHHRLVEWLARDHERTRSTLLGAKHEAIAFREHAELAASERRLVTKRERRSIEHVDEALVLRRKRDRRAGAFGQLDVEVDRLGHARIDHRAFELTNATCEHAETCTVGLR